MKKATLFIISLVFSLAIFAEEEAPKKIDFTKLEIEYISNENILTETELEAYSKISKEFDEKHRTLKREIRKLEKSIKDITSNEEAEKVMYEIVDKKIAQENLEKGKKFLEENAKQIAPGLSVEHGHVFCGSTDMGDLSYLLPVIQDRRAV